MVMKVSIVNAIVIILGMIEIQSQQSEISSEKTFHIAVTILGCLQLERSCAKLVFEWNKSLLLKAPCINKATKESLYLSYRRLLISIV